MNTIELHIEGLVLHGFNPADRYRIAHAVEQELTKLFGECDMTNAFTRSREIERVDTGVFKAAPSSKPETIGTQIGQAVHGGLNR